MSEAHPPRRWKRLVKLGLVALAMAAVLFVRPYRVEGPSMEPTFGDGDWVFTLPYWGEPQRGDVVVFEAPDGTGWSIKRVAGLPGDRPQREWLQLQPTPSKPPIDTSREQWGSADGPQSPLAAESYFLLGDDPSQSLDSRNYGPVDRQFVRRYVFASW